MIKKIKLSPEGMVKDLSKSKFPGQMYFDAQNIRIVATDQQSTFSITNEHGNAKLFNVPIPIVDVANRRIQYTGVDNFTMYLPYSVNGESIPRSEIEAQYVNEDSSVKTSGSQVIIGRTYSRDNVILFTTDDAGFDCVWEIENISSDIPVVVRLKYMRNMGFSTSNPIQAIYNYENNSIEKVYWVDGKNQLRFINLKQSIENKDTEELIDMSSSVVDVVGKFITSQPKLVSLNSGGNHTSGMIQYAFNLYRINGSQTALSPLSEIISLGKGNQGGDLNEVVSAMPTMSIKNIDKNYTHIKIYAIKYTSYNQSPSISLISDSLINNYEDTQFSDSGSIIKSISSAELLFLGSNVSIPKHIESKNLRLFLFNIKELKFDLDVDMRAYAHNSSGEAVVWSDVISDSNGGVTTSLSSNIINLDTTTYDLDEKHDSINRDYDTYKYLRNGSSYGVEGKYLILNVSNRDFGGPIENQLKNRYLKDREVYRFAIEFYNKKGQYSFPKWIADLKAPEGNLEGYLNILTVELKQEFYGWLSSLPDNDEKPIGYRILRSDRTESDKTIICQGIINSMIANLKKGGKETNKTVLATLSNKSDSLKMPSLQRPLIKNQIPFIGSNDYHELSANSYSDMSLGYGRNREGFKANPSGQWRAQNIQFNKMMQVFSPEITFSNPVFNISTKLNVVGIQKESRKNCWATEYNPVTKINEPEAKFIGGFTTASPGVTVQSISGNPNGLADQSIFGPTNNGSVVGVFQFFREFKNGFIPTPFSGIKSAEIYGTPEITEIGQESKPYNGDSLFRYSNSLKSMLIDNWDESSTNKDAATQVLGTNSYGAKCVTLMEGSDSSLEPISSRRSLEKIFTDAKFHEYTGGAGQPGPIYLLGNGSNSAMVVELTQEKNYDYLGGIYGGNSMEAKSRSSYIGIGSYLEINETINRIESPGDTYVGDFVFAKMTKTNEELSGNGYNQVTEIISIPLETTIDLNKRKDISINEWDNRYQPKEVEFHNYNKVYSQQPTFAQTTGTGFKFKSINEFDTKIISSSVKIAGEFIDNWTNFLENETRTLDGRYGPINAVSKLGDEIYTLQDTAIARLSIEPRVQTTATDGLSVQIGTGSVLNNHNYLSTESGTKNKWSVTATSSGIYYYDTINRSIGRVGQGVENLTESAGMHSFMTNNTELKELVKDNPLIGKGVSVGYNNIDNEVYMTFHQNVKSYTIAYNENKKAFTSFYGYKPSIYIMKGQRMITTNQTNDSGWQHFKGIRNNFYGETHKSSVTFLTSPGVDRDVVFNNAEYKMEMTNQEGKDLPNKTFSKIRLWNDYQDTGEVPLVLRSNIKRKFRNWSIEFPRVSNGLNKTRDRVRNPWTYIKFTFDNPEGNKMVAHDITVSYTEY